MTNLQDEVMTTPTLSCHILPLHMPKSDTTFSGTYLPISTRYSDPWASLSLLCTCPSRFRCLISLAFFRNRSPPLLSSEGLLLGLQSKEARWTLIIIYRALIKRFFTKQWYFKAWKKLKSFGAENDWENPDYCYINSEWNGNTYSSSDIQRAAYP